MAAVRNDTLVRSNTTRHMHPADSITVQMARLTHGLWLDTTLLFRLNLQIDALLLTGRGNIVNGNIFFVVVFILSECVLFLVDVLVQPPEHRCGDGTKYGGNAKYPVDN
jgi:hypothetical protein